MLFKISDVISPWTMMELAEGVYGKSCEANRKIQILDKLARLQLESAQSYSADKYC